MSTAPRAPQAGPAPSIPALQEASQLSLVIVDTSKKISRNKAAFDRLASDASEFVKDMVCFYQIVEGYFPNGVPEDLALVFLRVVNSLKSIRNLAYHVSSRNSFMAVLFCRLDVKEIKAHDQMLEMNKGSFNIIANAHVKGLLTKLSVEALAVLAKRLDYARLQLMNDVPKDISQSCLPAS